MTEVGTVVAMFVLIFFVGALLGLLIGVVACVRYVRQEMTARIAPTMTLMQLQLENVQSSVNLALATWHADVHTSHTVRSSTAELPRP
ncbi:hypothetical protein ABZ345_06050 [Lentzea sp. NPDC005914]|uniref:hypothetical protein n=1 Tax=Lentzea sp. NPDC005914 TaxID=3154572 RepID=UPI0033E6BD3A